jgi:16S rRNA (guanine527-N7)-methyltransferase
MNEVGHTAGERLNALLKEAGLEGLGAAEEQRFAEYLSLILRWNARINLTSIRDQEGILSRHFVESIACAQALPRGIATLLDFGSGAGLPGVPIAICRPEIVVTLAESQGKKAAFLQEAVRVLGIPAKVYAHRAQGLETRFDCAVLRAVERMPQAVVAAAGLVKPAGWLALMTTRASVRALQTAAAPGFRWDAPVLLPNGTDRLLSLGRRVSS